MKTNVSIIYQSDWSSFLPWDTFLEKESLVDHFVSLCAGTGLFDAISVFSDDKGLASYCSKNGITFTPFAEHLYYDFNYLANITLHNETWTLENNGLYGDVHFFLNMTHPLLQGESIVGMYNALLENRFAAKVVATYQIEPHLLMELPGENNYIGLWGQPGLDRQLHPPLMRTVGSCFVHKGRMGGFQPLAFPYVVDRIQGCCINSEEDIQLVRYMLRSAQDG